MSCLVSKPSVVVGDGPNLVLHSGPYTYRSPRPLVNKAITWFLNASNLEGKDGIVF